MLMYGGYVSTTLMFMLPNCFLPVYSLCLCWVFAPMQVCCQVYVEYLHLCWCVVRSMLSISTYAGVLSVYAEYLHLCWCVVRSMLSIFTYAGVLSGLCWVFAPMLVCCQGVSPGPHLVPGRGMSDLSPAALRRPRGLLHTLRLQKQDHWGTFYIWYVVNCVIRKAVKFLNLIIKSSKCLRHSSAYIIKKRFLDNDKHILLSVNVYFVQQL